MCEKSTEEFCKDEVQKISSFIRTGLFTLSIIFIAGIAIIFSQRNMEQPSSIATLANGLLSQKELPIYCVDSTEPKIAISFDAAWGNDILCYMDC